MKNKKSEIEFEIKKKVYSSPNVKEYGTFSEYTKGTFNGQGNPDGQQYYGADLNS